MMLAQLFPSLHALEPLALLYDLAISVGVSFGVAAGIIILLACYLASRKGWRL